VLETDEDAEFKRAILQLIYVDDISTFQNLLQLKTNKGIEDIYDMAQG